MAKFQGIIGTGRGKAGNLVFAKGDNGETIARAYQPQVKNPRTASQLRQRSKMNVVGQFSALVPASLIAPLGMGGQRRNRSEFSRILLNAADVTFTEGNYVAKFAPAAVKFSKGTAELLTTAADPVVATNKVTITLTTSNVPDEMLSSYGERIVVGVLDDDSNALYDSIHYIDHIVTSNTNTETVVVNFNRPLEDGQTVVVWRMAYHLNAAGASVASKDIFLGDDNKITALMETSSTSLVSHWGDTYVVGIVPFVPGS